ncbi:efflux RND transporter periplasmic adaptor subunit [Paracoccus binzhouensis]|uniref:efflux RND transporter periplasmic adaptor subunit n=1 Tax=Paracoccus binzhouensis TaxID=2796149 RepID=UPI001E3FFB8D|nr:efflux RND transporter periplasmic adaptor subunit [Paracoccus binzhouensis]
MRRPALLALLLSLVLAQGAPAFDLPWRKPRPAPEPPPRPVVSIVVSDDMTAGASVPGVIAARIEVALGFQTLGRVTARNVDIGDTVGKGQVLATLNPEDLRGEVRAAQAAVDAARVELRTVQATADRTRALARRNVASAAQLEQVERALAAARAAEQQAESELIRARDAEGFAEMRAPFDGVISAVFANAGAVVSAGEPVVRLSAQDGIEAVIDLPDIALSRIRHGDPYEVWSETEPDRLLPATVSQIEPVADAVTRTRRIHLALPEDADLRLGALVRARPGSAATARLVLPQAAILDRNGAPHVWVVDRTGNDARVALRGIAVQGPARGGRVTVESGLDEGEEVVIRGIHSLTEGQSVGPGVTP